MLIRNQNKINFLEQTQIVFISLTYEDKFFKHLKALLRIIIVKK